MRKVQYMHIKSKEEMWKKWDNWKREVGRGDKLSFM